MWQTPSTPLVWHFFYKYHWTQFCLFKKKRGAISSNQLCNFLSLPSPPLATTGGPPPPSSAVWKFKSHHHHRCSQYSPPTSSPSSTVVPDFTTNLTTIFLLISNQPPSPLSHFRLAIGTTVVIVITRSLLRLCSTLLQNTINNNLLYIFRITETDSS